MHQCSFQFSVTEVSSTTRDQRGWTSALVFVKWKALLTKYSQASSPLVSQQVWLCVNYNNTKRCSKAFRHVCHHLRKACHLRHPIRAYLIGNLIITSLLRLPQVMTTGKVHPLQAIKKKYFDFIPDMLSTHKIWRLILRQKKNKKNSHTSHKLTCTTDKSCAHIGLMLMINH